MGKSLYILMALAARDKFYAHFLGCLWLYPLNYNIFPGEAAPILASVIGEGGRGKNSVFSYKS